MRLERLIFFGYFLLACLPINGQQGREKDARTLNAPRFEEYPAGSIFKGQPAVPRFRRDDFDSELAHYREGVKFHAARGPNFAGHYTVAKWTCGTGCSGMVVVDANDGRIFDGPYGTLIIGRPNSFEGLSYRLDSRLLVAEGCFDVDRHPDVKDCARKYFEWKDEKFVLLRRIPVRRKSLPRTKSAPAPDCS